MQKILQKLKRVLIIVGVVALLKVTGALNGISAAATNALLHAGFLDFDPGVAVTSNQRFDYDFKVRDLSGKLLDMKDLKGKVIFLNLWATWCGPCRVEMPSIQKLYNDTAGDRIAFVMLTLDQEEQYPRVAEYVSEKKYTFPVYLPASPLPSLLRVNSIPTTFVIGTDGKVKSKKSGAANYDTAEFRAFLTGLGNPSK